LRGDHQGRLRRGGEGRTHVERAGPRHRPGVEPGGGPDPLPVHRGEPEHDRGHHRQGRRSADRTEDPPARPAPRYRDRSRRPDRGVPPAVPERPTGASPCDQGAHLGSPARGDLYGHAGRGGWAMSNIDDVRFDPRQLAQKRREAVAARGELLMDIAEGRLSAWEAIMSVVLDDRAALRNLRLDQILTTQEGVGAERARRVIEQILAVLEVPSGTTDAKDVTIGYIL